MPVPIYMLLDETVAGSEHYNALTLPDRVALPSANVLAEDLAPRTRTVYPPDLDFDANDPTDLALL